MRWPVALAVALVAVASVAVPADAKPQPGIENPAGAAPATLYFHLLNIQDFPINTQAPDERFTEDTTLGLATHTLSCVPNPPASNLFTDWHTYRGYSSPSYVQYDAAMDGKPAAHPERGLGDDVRFHAGSPLMLHWFLESTAGPTGSAPLPVAGVVVEATLRASDAVSVDDTAYDTGPVIAAGRSPPALLAADATQGAEHSVVDGRHVYGITVPLDLEQDSIPKETGYTLRIDVYTENPACGQLGDGAVMPNGVQPYTDIQHRPRIEASVLSQLHIDHLVPSFDENGTVSIVANVTSVWGGYDVDESNLTLLVEGPDVSVRLEPDELRQHIAEFYHHHEPANLRWTFDRDGAKDGLYWVTLQASNDQHTAAASATAAFRLGPDATYPAFAGEPATEPGEGPVMPGVGAVPLAVAVVLAAMLASRGRR